MESVSALSYFCVTSQAITEKMVLDTPVLLARCISLQNGPHPGLLQCHRDEWEAIERCCHPPNAAGTRA